MTQAFFYVFVFLIILALVPWGLRWLRLRSVGGAVAASAATRVVSAAAVGPHQRVVTVEVGPPGARVWLVLGVTAQAVSHLHTMAAEAGADKGLISDAKEGERAQTS
jgi:flagellar protein FliO/FliZ